MLAFILLATVLLVAGCSGGGSPRGGTPAAATERAADRVIELPHCDGAWVPRARSFTRGWRARSIRIGPVLIVEGKALARLAPSKRQARKVRALIPPSRAITIELEGGSRVGLLKDAESRWTAADLHRAIRVENCPPLPREIGPLYAGQRYGLPLFVGVRRAACLPITVTRNGGRPHRRVLSFGAGRCN